MPDDYRHPAPPCNRSRKPGRGVAHLTVVNPGVGRHQTNMSVPPIVHTDGKGERVLYHARAVIEDAELTDGIDE